jgi:hypothetical protein
MALGRLPGLDDGLPQWGGGLVLVGHGVVRGRGRAVHDPPVRRLGASETDW